jgi:general nucleoside transport system ATP-binding protein
VTNVLELSGISKRFGATQALRSVDFTLGAGEIHALLGENGAGKSTLMNVAFGLVRADSGTIAVRGRIGPIRDPIAARGLGIGMVHQHFTSIPRFTVAENVALATGWALNPRQLRARVRMLCEDTGLDLDPDAPVQELSAGLKQRLEVLKALAADARILLLDEPSSVLSPMDAESMLGLIKGLCGRGISSVLITHKLDEALGLADRVTVLRRGKVAHHGAVADASAAELAMHMLGETPQRSAREQREPGEVRVRAARVVVPRVGVSGTGLRSATFAAHAGEVVGVAAIEGNGQRELLRAIVGLVQPSEGTLTVTGPVAFIPEDRTTEALVGGFSLTENLVLSQGAAAPWVRGQWLDWHRARKRTAELIEQFAIGASGPEATAHSLSGGNQQRIVIAGALERQPAVLVAENLTRGLDLRATADMHDRLRAAAAAGACVVVHLADLDELRDIADRILVLASGVLSELAAGASRMDIGRRMLGSGQ